MAGQLWFFYALTTAVCWGLGYALSERILHNGVSGSFLIGVYYAIGVPIFLVLAFISKSFKPSIEVLSSNKTVLLSFVAMTMCYLLGNYLIYKSIALKNASLTNLIEISYPFFTILFSWLIFREFQLTLASVAGAILIFSGVTLIFLKG